ncbi:type II toxin-antitoxin system PemK/MazF family toxin [Agromyces mediolanus]|uniref:type II toxin-antitoxin system PemK/MazF family toxin n=1 Tax=Agromyces mediolanus TaxID=41986 RepID=UPI002041AF40|nr:type II toxin-antitoxin system PemK/MazF family toxin [Agromyces mediolanus]MCM3657056.1 type II toxin-antitoxin system PemK/MazF family toxin [Agromyces mediolanus]
MSDTSRFLTALVRAFGQVFRSNGRARAGAPGAPSRAARGSTGARQGGVATETLSPGQTGAAATEEIDPRGLGRVTLSYAPTADGEPDPGEIVWTWVPFEEHDGRGKDRPVVIVAAGAGDRFLAVQLTSKGRPGDRDYLGLGAGPWDAEGRPSWVRLDRVFLVHGDGMRREAASLDEARYRLVADALRSRYGWR